MFENALYLSLRRDLLLAHPYSATMDVEDALQHAYEKLLQSENIQEVRNWLFKVASNYLKDERKHSSRETPIEVHHLRVHAPTWDTHRHEEALHEIAAILQADDPLAEAVLYLRYYEGYSFEEIAHHFTSNGYYITSATLRMRLNRAYERARSYLERTHLWLDTKGPKQESNSNE